MTGSHRKEGLQLWDLRTMENSKNIAWGDKESTSEQSSIYSAKFTNPKKEFIVAGGADKHIAKIFSSDTGKIVSVFGNMQKACLITETSPEGALCFLGCGDGSVQVKNLLYA